VSDRRFQLFLPIPLCDRGVVVGHCCDAVFHEYRIFEPTDSGVPGYLEQLIGPGATAGPASVCAVLCAVSDLPMRPPAGRAGVTPHEQEDILLGVVGQRAHLRGVGEPGPGLAAAVVLRGTRVAPGDGEKWEMTPTRTDKFCDRRRGRGR